MPMWACRSKNRYSTTATISPPPRRSCTHSLSLDAFPWCSRRAAPSMANQSAFPSRRTIHSGRSTHMGTPSCSWSACWRIFGDDYDTPDGTCVRDYVHVSDIADAHVKALEHLLNGGESGALNLANARGFSVREVIAAAEEVCGRAVPYETAARRPGDPPVLLGDAGRARTLLGWQPARSDLAMQIEDAWRWMQAQ